MITEIAPSDVISYCRSVLGLEPDAAAIDDTFLICLLRRTAGMLCPCSRAVLRSALTESLSSLGYDDALSDRLEWLIDDLVVAGDLLELSEVTTDDTEAKGTWVFAAPPSFIVRKSGTIFLTGIIPDQDSLLPSELNARVIHTHNTRTIAPNPGEDLSAQLTREGLNHLPESIWLKSPKPLSPSEMLSKHARKLLAEPQSAPVAGLELIEHATRVTYYRGRWSPPTNQTGTFVARRPQEFGAPIWCFVELSAGLLVRIIDLPAGAYRWRACDAAWYLQMAIDSTLEQPQQYRMCDAGSGNTRFDFFSPLPLWAERRLMVLGRKCAGEKSLFAYVIPAAEAAQEAAFLRDNLWLAPIENTEGRHSG